MIDEPTGIPRRGLTLSSAALESGDLTATSAEHKPNAIRLRPSGPSSIVLWTGLNCALDRPGHSPVSNLNETCSLMR